MSIVCDTYLMKTIKYVNNLLSYKIIYTIKVSLKRHKISNHKHFIKIVLYLMFSVERIFNSEKKRYPKYFLHYCKSTESFCNEAVLEIQNL